MTLAILCSGQGPQHPGMFDLTGDAPAAAAAFAHAAGLLGGRDARSIVRTEDDDALHENRLGQVLCTLQPLAVAAALDGFGSARLIFAGYSVGEIPAWAMAGLFEPSTALDLAAKRADAMDAASYPGEGLLFVRGLAKSAIDALCARHGVAVAIVNPGDAVVLGGAGTALDGVAGEARRLGAARVVRIGVKVASHTPRLAGASAAFRRDLDGVPVARELPATRRLLSGVDATPVLDVRSGLDKLAAQISRTVRWSECLSACVEAGATAFLECGPGRALAEMASATYPSIPCRSVEDFRTLDGLSGWLSRISAKGIENIARPRSRFPKLGGTDRSRSSACDTTRQKADVPLTARLAPAADIRCMLERDGIISERIRRHRDNLSIRGWRRYRAPLRSRRRRPRRCVSRPFGDRA